MKIACFHKQNEIGSDKSATLGTIQFLSAVLVITAIASLVFQAQLATASSGQAMTVEGKYPGPASGALKPAQLIELPAGLILRMADLEILESELQAKMAGTESNIRKQLEENLFFLIEQEATRKILVYEARNSGWNTEGLSDSEVRKSHMDRIFPKKSVSEAELKSFYEANKKMVSGIF